MSKQSVNMKKIFHVHRFFGYFKPYKYYQGNSWRNRWTWKNISCSPLFLAILSRFFCFYFVCLCIFFLIKNFHVHPHVHRFFGYFSKQNTLFPPKRWTWSFILMFTAFSPKLSHILLVVNMVNMYFLLTCFFIIEKIQGHVLSEDMSSQK